MAMARLARRPQLTLTISDRSLISIAPSTVRPSSIVTFQHNAFSVCHVVPTLGIGIFAAGVAALQRRLEEFGYQLLVAASD